MKNIVIVLIVILTVNVYSAEISTEDREYLTKLAKDTYRFIDDFTVKKTGLAYDSFTKADNTSVTNIGLYAASVAAAVEFGFEDYNSALAKVTNTVSSIEKFWKQWGFTQSWNNVYDCSASKDDVAISVLDSGNFVSG